MNINTLDLTFSNQGLLLNPDIVNEIDCLISADNSITDVVFCIYGWFETYTDGMNIYDYWTTNIINKFNPNSKILQLNVFWPSIISQDNNLENTLQPLSWWNDCQAADQIGENGLTPIIQYIRNLTLIYNNKVLIRYNFIAHSLGNRIACSAMGNLTQGIYANLIMLQAAVDYDAFDLNMEYSRLGDSIDSSINNSYYSPKIRIFNTKSELDTALTKIYIDAQELLPWHKTQTAAMGAYGISPTMYTLMSGEIIEIDVNYKTPDLSKNNLIVADLTPLHLHDGSPSEPFAGKHNDILRPEISSAINSFLYRDM